ncbi:Ig-like domain-containing protein [Listeria sp. PSOL-1]|uniref:Ig-like domain-containing protein n=1 Tax=Listeria sp. PSOL-1 TaxID=1844999 RepID=UPI0013D71FA2|nr:Ig-like domain-containing protein [Listeria sp. PSOL-1]
MKKSFIVILTLMMLSMTLMQPLSAFAKVSASGTWDQYTVDQRGGQSQVFTVSGLTPGQSYTIKADMVIHSVTATPLTAVGNVAVIPSIVVNDYIRSGLESLVYLPVNGMGTQVYDREMTVTSPAFTATTTTAKVYGYGAVEGIVSSNNKAAAAVLRIGNIRAVKAGDSDGGNSEITARPVVNPVTEIDKTVTGTAEPNAQIMIGTRDSLDRFLALGSSHANSAGQFTVSIPAQKKGIILYTSAQAPNKLSSGETAVVVGNAPVTATPTINNITDTDTQITGTAAPNSTVIAKVNSQVIGTGSANSSGIYSIAIAKQSAGTVVSVTAKEGSKQESAAVTTTVIANKTATPKVDPVKDTDSEITGTAVPNSTITAKVGSQVIGTGSANGSGNYSITIMKQPAGTVVSITAKEGSKQESTAVTTTVIANKTAIPKVDPIKDTDSEVTGTATPNSTVTAKVGSQVIGIGTANGSGNYTITITKQSAGTVVSVTAKEGSKQESAAVTTTVIANKTATPKVNTVKDTDSELSGTAAPYSTITAKVGSQVIGTGSANGSGIYTITITKQSAGTVVSVTAKEGSKQESAAVTTTVIANKTATPKVDPVKDTDSELSGTAAPYSIITAKVGGQVIGTGSANGSGNYSITITKQSAGAVVSVTAKEGAKQESIAVTTTVLSNKTAAPTVNPVNTVDTTISGTAEPYSQILVKAGGTVIASGQANSSGNYLLTLTAMQTAGTELSVTAKNGSKQESTATITIVQAAGKTNTPTVNTVTDADVLITGTATPNSIVSIKISGQVIKTGVADSNGSYAIGIPSQPASTVISVTAKASGKEESASVTTTVIASKTSAPTINTVKDTDSELSGTAAPYSTITAKVAGEIIGTGSTNGSGIYTITITKQSAGTVISVTAKEENKQESAAATTTVVSNKTATPKVNPVKDTDSELSGTAAPYSTITAKVAGEIIGTGSANGSGIYTITITKQSAGTVISVTAKEENKQKSAAATTTVVSNKTATPKVNPVKDTDSELNGTATPYSTITAKVAGQVIGTGSANGSGIYTITITKQTAGTVIHVTAKEGSKQESAAATTTVKAVLDYSLTVPKSYAMGTKTITGTYGKGLAYIRLFINGKVVTQATTDSQGNYTINNADKYITKNTDQVDIVGVDQRYVEQTRKAVPVTGEIDYSLTVPTNYQIGTKTITGTYGKGLAYIRLFVNGKVVTQATTDSQGNYTVNNADKYITKNADQVDIVGVDQRYVEQARKAIPVTGEIDYSLTVPTSYQTGTKTITGTHGKDLAYIRLFVNGKVEAQAITDGQGRYTFNNVDKYVTRGTDKIEIVGVDKRYVEHARKIVPTTGGDLQDDHLTVDSYRLGSAQLTGTYGSHLAYIRLFVNGKVEAQAITDGQGNYTFNKASAFIRSHLDQVEVVGVDSMYKEYARINVPLSGSLDNTLTAKPFMITENTLSGTHGTNIAYVRLIINGKTEAQAILDDQGNYTFTNMKKYDLQSTDKVDVVGVDARYVEQNRIAISLLGNYDYSLKADSYNFKDPILTGTYGQDIAYVRLVVNGTIQQQATLDPTTHTYKFTSVEVTPTDKVEIIGVDKKYREQNRIYVPVTGNYDYSLATNGYVIKTATLTGTAGADVKYVTLKINGIGVAETSVTANGTFAFANMNSYEIQPNDVVQLVSQDRTKQNQVTIHVPITGNYNYSLTASPYLLGDATIVGTFGADVAKVILKVNGTIVAEGVKGTASAYTISNANQWITSLTDQAEVVALNSKGKEVAHAAVAIDKVRDYKLDITSGPYTVGSWSYVHGNMGADIQYVRLYQNGIPVRTGKINPDGTYDIYVTETITAANWQDTFEIVGLDSQLKVVNRVNVIVQK